MGRTFGILGRLRAFACLLIAIVMVAVPPSMSHAASEMHGDHHGAAVSVSYDCPHHRDDLSRSDRRGDARRHHAGTSDTPTFDECCDGICQAAVIDIAAADAVADAERRAFRLQDDQSASIRSVVLRRPPRPLN